MTAYPRLAELGDTVVLIPFSGIQTLELGLKVDDHRARRADFWEQPIRQSGDDHFARLKRVTPDPDSRDFVVQGTRDVVPSDEVYTIRAAEALETFDRAWIPLPVFRVHVQRRGQPTLYDPGPQTWARLYVVKLDRPDERGNSHRVLIAFDTNTVRQADQPEGGAYLAPLDTDSEQSRSFAFVDDPERIQFFAGLPFVDQWLDETCQTARDRKLLALGKDPRRVPANEGPKRVCEHWARYLTLLDLIRDAVKLPTFMLAGTLSANNIEPPVKVDLVLDIGNSRTCGILIERHSGLGHPTLNNSYPLELRDLSRPERVYAEPFESRVEFSKVDFGNERLAHLSGRSNAFVWDSMLRTGPEAVDLCVNARGGEGATGLSSPKRYLWDERAQEAPWRFNMSLHRQSGGGPLPVESPVMAYVSDNGTVLSALRGEKRKTMQGAFEPLFSRASLFTFMLQEILLHAFVQINAIANRARLPSSDRQRVLDKIVLTLPPGMPVPERRKFAERAKAAVNLLWDCLSTYDAHLFNEKTRPKVEEPFDEASSTQIVYLYSEVQKLQHGISDLVEIWGREREIKERRDGRTETRRAPTLRIASIDIGGGTTDLMVITHEVQNRTQIIPHQNFRESFRLAGDDILRHVVMLSVLPSIEAYARSMGIADARELTGRMFGADRAGMTEPERQRRRQLVTEVIAPIGISILAACEGLSDGTGAQVTQKPVREFFAGRKAPSRHTIEHFNDVARQLGASGFDLLDAPITVDLHQAEKTIEGVMDQPLSALCEVVHDLDCDLLVLSGRPSRLPIVREMILSNLPLTPDRVIGMSGYRVGNWYPFRNHLGQISDPKTTTAVGAALTWLARGELGGIRFESGYLRQRSTVRYLGALEESGDKLRNTNVVMTVDLDTPVVGGLAPAIQPIVMPNRMLIGYRQLPIERWIAMPLYELSFTRPENTVPVRVTIQRDDRASRGNDDEVIEEFVVEEVEALREDFAGSRAPSPGDVQLRLQTLPNRNGYWLDTGVILL